MSQTQSTWLRLAGIAGILTPVSALLFIGASIGSYRWFSWTGNALSDLGIVTGATAMLFNFGLFLSGFLALTFTIGLYILLRQNIIGKLGVGVFVLACLSLEGISFFPENMRPFHYIFSVMFFVFMPIALIVITVYYFKIRQKRMALFTLMLAVIAVVPWGLQFTLHYVSGVAIPEAISAAAGSAWVLLLGGKMVKAVSQTSIS